MAELEKAAPDKVDLSKKAADARAKMEGVNPSAEPGKREAGGRQRISLNAPQMKLETPNLPGYHLRWIRGTAQRLAQAERAGFEFVNPGELETGSVLVGGDAAHSGSTDMGSRVSVVAGDVDDSGQAIRLYLMKQKLEYYLQDKEELEKRNDSVAEALTHSFRKGTIGGRAQGETAEDMAHRYVDPARTKVPDLFRKKRRG